MMANKPETEVEKDFGSDLRLCWDDGLGQTGSSVLCFFGDESFGSEPQSPHYCQGYIFCGAVESN